MSCSLRAIEGYVNAIFSVKNNTVLHILHKKKVSVSVLGEAQLEKLDANDNNV